MKLPVTMGDLETMTEQESSEIHDYIKRKGERESKRLIELLEFVRKISKSNRPKTTCPICNRLWDTDEKCSCGYDPIEYLKKYFSHS